MKSFLKQRSEVIIAILLISFLLYGMGRLYFQMTAGFTEGNIKTNLSLEPDHKIPPLASNEMEKVLLILEQQFDYLGKGCQSYVFLSADKQYVIKFLKYQRYRPQFYLEAFSFIPWVNHRLQKKSIEKRKKLDGLLDSWKIAYSDLRKETGLVYMHLNREDVFSSPLNITDKLGLKHKINPNEVVFLIQKKASMLCAEIADRMKIENVKGSTELIQNLISMLLSEYERGLGDNDHALMQNTGVIGNLPLHIDVGQLSKEERFKDPATYKHEIFSKTYKFRIWLLKNYPSLERFLSTLLLEIIGPEMNMMKPSLKTVDEGA